MTDHSPRTAVVLLSDALGHLDLVEPASAREPIRQMFRAAIEVCAIRTSLLGTPIAYTLELAQALVDDAAGRPT
jgi:hypothetical protein